MKTRHAGEINENGFFITSLYMDEHGQPVKRTPLTHPYSYDGYVTWHTKDKTTEANNTVYSDRLWQWDYKKTDELCQKHFGDKGQHFDNRDAGKIEAFLKEWQGASEFKLVRVMKYCNLSSGFPIWRFDYYSK